MKPEVYYNQNCSICRIEINHYKKNCNTLEWIEINKSKQFLNKIPRSKNELLRRIHVKNDDKIIIGIDAFIFIWSKIPKYHLLSKLLKLPIIYWLIFICYELLAFLLYIKNYRQYDR